VKEHGLLDRRVEGDPRHLLGQPRQKVRVVVHDLSHRAPEGRAHAYAPQVLDQRIFHQPGDTLARLLGSGAHLSQDVLVDLRGELPSGNQVSVLDDSSMVKSAAVTGAEARLRVGDVRPLSATSLFHGGVPVILRPMKTAISLPDDIFSAVDARASALKVSRSALIALALREYLERSGSGESATEAWDRAIAEGGQPGKDPAARAFMRRSKKVVARSRPAKR